MKSNGRLSWKPRAMRYAKKDGARPAATSAAACPTSASDAANAAAPESCVVKKLESARTRSGLWIVRPPETFVAR